MFGHRVIYYNIWEQRILFHFSSNSNITTVIAGYEEFPNLGIEMERFPRREIDPLCSL